MIPKLNPIAMMVLKTTLAADDGWGGCERPLGGGEVEGESAVGTSGEGGGLPKGELDGDAGDTVGADFGDSSGEGEEVSGAGEAGDGEVSGAGEAGGGVLEEACGVGAAREDCGGFEGDAGAGEVDARVSIPTFIPTVQCPGAPQMKYLLPGEESGMTVLPSV